MNLVPNRRGGAVHTPHNLCPPRTISAAAEKNISLAEFAAAVAIKASTFAEASVFAEATPDKTARQDGGPRGPQRKN